MLATIVGVSVFRYLKYLQSIYTNRNALDVVMDCQGLLSVTVLECSQACSLEERVYMILF